MAMVTRRFIFRPALSRWLMLAVLASTTLAVAGCGPSIYTLRQRGLTHYQADRYDRAKQAFERVIEHEPSDPAANYYLGLLALRNGEAEEARNHLEIARTLYEAQSDTPPHLPRLLDALAEAMFREGERRQVITFTEEAIDRFGTLRDYLRKAEYLARLGDHDSALTAYRSAIKIAEPGVATAHLALADFYESIGDRRRAIDTLKEAYRIAPDNARTADRLRAYGIVPGPTLLDSEDG